MDRERIDHLHQQASEAYLSGKFTDAHLAWSRVLEVDPTDRRAREGMRLCAARTGEVPPPVPQDEGGDGAGPVLSELDRDIEAARGPATVADAGALPFDLDAAGIDDPGLPGIETDDRVTPAERSIDEVLAERAATEVPTPDRQGDGIDVGDLDDIPSLDVAAPAATAGEDAAQPSPSMPDLAVDDDLLDGVLDTPAAAAPDEDAGAEPTGLEAVPEGGAAETELRRRTQELLAEARHAVQQGDDAEALAVLARLSILVDDHPEAVALEAEIRERLGSSGQDVEDAIGEAVQWMEHGRVEEARDKLRDVLERAPGHAEAEHYLEQAESRLAEAGSGPSTDDHGNIDLDAGGDALDLGAGPAGAADEPFDPGNVDLSAGDDEAPGLADLPGGPRPSGPPSGTTFRAPATPDAGPASSGKRRTPLLLAVVGVVAIAAGVYFGTDLFRGDDGDAGGGAAAAATTAGRQTATSDGTDSGKTTAQLLEEADRLAAQATGSAPTRDVADRVSERLAEARDAMASSEWERAILEYDAVLELDPNNREAAAGLLDAGAGYRERKAQEAEFDRAVRAFESGDYTSALRVLYRLPEDLRVEDALRLKIEGWYNLGVIELRAGNLSEARSHFGEALALDADDRAAAGAAELIDRYRGQPLDGTYYTTVDRLEFRGPGA